MRKSVEQQLLDFLKSTDGRVASGQLQRMPWYNKSGRLSTPRSIVRRLEENAEEGGVLKVSYENGAAFYEYKKDLKPKKQIKVDLPDGSCRVMYV